MFFIQTTIFIFAIVNHKCMHVLVVFSLFSVYYFLFHYLNFLVLGVVLG